MKFSIRFIVSTSLIMLLLGLVSNACKEAPKEQNQAADLFAAADKIIEDIVVPQFPDRSFSIMDFGAVADGVSNSTEAFKLAIDTCHKEGGGTVIVPIGSYLTGPIHLKSNVNLHLEEGAEVLFTKELSAYLPVVHTSYEGVELMNYSPLIYAYKKKISPLPERAFLMDRQVILIGGLGVERKDMGILMGNHNKRMGITCLVCVK